MKIRSLLLEMKHAHENYLPIKGSFYTLITNKSRLSYINPLPVSIIWYFRLRKKMTLPVNLENIRSPNVLKYVKAFKICHSFGSNLINSGILSPKQNITGLLWLCELETNWPCPISYFKILFRKYYILYWKKDIWTNLKQMHVTYVLLT
jgi:hypothetical protein